MLLCGLRECDLTLFAKSIHLGFRRLHPSEMNIVLPPSMPSDGHFVDIFYPRDALNLTTNETLSMCVWPNVPRSNKTRLGTMDPLGQCGTCVSPSDIKVIYDSGQRPDIPIRSIIIAHLRRANRQRNFERHFFDIANSSELYSTCVKKPTLTASIPQRLPEDQVQQNCRGENRRSRVREGPALYFLDFLRQISFLVLISRFLNLFAYILLAKHGDSASRCSLS
ncbi:hypothetical protein L596_002301 [Steinernema carpocapsae]|uniref:Uncharacterized protein n=1 Tax=Steinernema carpocapsae TaxID=34508 RepID=A0A4U8UNR9_STECR|nr:hypothetical protein L596_002301 [Steinernema carpocapsae]